MNYWFALCKLDPSYCRGLFKHLLTSFSRGQSSNLKLSFETQSFKPKKKQKKKQWKLFRLFGESLIYSFFTFRNHQWCKKSIQKEKLQSREWNVCVWQMSFSAIVFPNKITASIFQIIHIWNKTLNPCVNGGLERRCKVETHLQGLFTFWY